LQLEESTQNTDVMEENGNSPSNNNLNLGSKIDQQITEDEILDYLIPKLGYSLITILQLRVLSKNSRDASKRKVPFVGQYCIFDIFYLISHTMKSLPHDLSSFKNIVFKYFPTLIDTKVMASKFKDIISSNFSTGLNSMVNYFMNKGPQSL
jgi:CAF1 family ribonuclease